MRAPFLLPLLLAGCSPERNAPIAARALQNGPPVSWKLGDRILVEGSIDRAESGDYILRNVAGEGRMATRNCLLLRGVTAGPSLPHLRLWWAAATGHAVTVTGKSTERFPSYPISGGQHQRAMCDATLVPDAIDLR